MTKSVGVGNCADSDVMDVVSIECRSEVFSFEQQSYVELALGTAFWHFSLLYHSS